MSKNFLRKVVARMANGGKKKLTLCFKMYGSKCLHKAHIMVEERRGEWKTLDFLSFILFFD